MGTFLTKFLQQLREREEELKIIIIGLDNSGKTTILNKLHQKEVKETAPTVGFNMEVVTYRNLNFQVWDLGGQDSFRKYWETYFRNTNLIFYVVDCSDRQRFHKSAEQLHKVLENERLKKAPLLILANKQDVKGSAGEKQIIEAFSLSKLNDRDWSITKCSGRTGKGIYESMSWALDKVS